MAPISHKKRMPTVVADESKAKKAKVLKIDPVQEKINMICGALEDPDFQAPCRSTLVAVASFALGAPKDERSKHQETMAGVLNEVFEEESTRLQGCITDAQASKADVDMEKQSRADTKESINTELEAKKEDVAAKEATLAEHESTLADAEVSREEALEAQSAADTALESLRAEKARILTAQHDSFEMLKDGAFELVKEQKRHIDVLKPLFKKLSVDASLHKVLPLALGMKPSDRGEFDLMVVQQLEETLAAHISSLEERLEVLSADLVEKSGAVEVTEAVIEYVTEKRDASSEALAAAKAEHVELDKKLCTAKRAVVAYQVAVIEANGDVDIARCNLERLQEVLEVLVQVRHRVGRDEPAEPEEEVVEEVVAEQASPEPMEEVVEEVTERPVLAPTKTSKQIEVGEPVQAELQAAGLASAEAYRAMAAVA